MKHSANELWAEADSRPVASTSGWVHHPAKYDTDMCRCVPDSWTYTLASRYFPSFSLVFKITCTVEFGEWILTGTGIDAEINLGIKSSFSQERDFNKAVTRVKWFLADFFHDTDSSFRLPFQPTTL